MSEQQSFRFSVIPARAVDDKRLGSAAIRVLLVLGTYANRDGWCYPSMATIAKRLGISEAAIRKQIRLLERYGYLRVEHRQRENGSTTTNLYRILHDVDIPPEHDRLQEGEPEVPPEPEVRPGGNLKFGGPEPLEVRPPRTSRGSPQNDPIEQPNELGGGAPYAFVGRVIRLKPNDFERWRTSYPHIPDIIAELQAADDYYAENPPRGGKWFFAVSRWLKRANDEAQLNRQRRKEGTRGEDWW